MAILTGRYGQVMWDPTGATPGTPVEIASIKNFKLSLKTDKIDVTCFGDENKVYIPGMKDISGIDGRLLELRRCDARGSGGCRDARAAEAGSELDGAHVLLVGLAYMDADIDTRVGWRARARRHVCRGRAVGAGTDRSVSADVQIDHAARRDGCDRLGLSARGGAHDVVDYLRGARARGRAEGHAHAQESGAGLHAARDPGRIRGSVSTAAAAAAVHGAAQRRATGAGPWSSSRSGSARSSRPSVLRSIKTCPDSSDLRRPCSRSPRAIRSPSRPA